MPNPAPAIDRIRARLEAEPAIQEALRDLEEDRIRRQREAARRDPKAHKLSPVFDELRYRYFDGGKDADGVIHYFAYSTTRNVAGFYLSWHESYNTEGHGKRDRHCAHKLRREAKANALRAWELHGVAR